MDVRRLETTDPKVMKPGLLLCCSTSRVITSAFLFTSILLPPLHFSEQIIIKMFGGEVYGCDHKSAIAKLSYDVNLSLLQ